MTQKLTAPPPPRPVAVRVETATQMFGLSRTDIYQLLRDGRLDARKRGNVTLIMVASLDSYMDSLPRAIYRQGGAPHADERLLCRGVGRDDIPKST